MSVDNADNLESPEEPKKNKRTKAKVRKHLVTTAYKNDIAEKLDKLCAAGHTILAVFNAADVRGFEIVSYFEE